MSAHLPIELALPDLRAALRAGTNAVLVAPPGAGKTTRVPLALLAEDWVGAGRIMMLEPRRVATRAAAERMAQTLGEKVGETVGYRIRGESAVSSRTRIEVVTEGILTRRLQSDPGLEGVAVVIFDEFHERSIHADLGLALTLEAQGALREDLRILVMSATLDGEAVAGVMENAAVIRSEGRAFPVDIRWLERPWRTPHTRRGVFEAAMTETIARAYEEEPDDVLAFLPGVAEIERVRGALELSGADIRPLHGSLPFKEQRKALAPATDGRRRVVLATNIAETSLTIDGVRIVVDGGLARAARFDAGAGMSRLVTQKISKASAIQRAGRAGRTEPGVAYRLWTRGEEGGMAPAGRAEILDADLAPLALELALWGVEDPHDLNWLDPPPEGALEQARALLRELGALDGVGRPTAHGEALARAPLHPRLAHMRSVAKSRLAAELAAVLEDRDPLRSMGADLRKRVEALRGDGKDPALWRIRDAAKALSAKGAAAGDPAHTGRLIALAYPDRIAMRRPGDAPRYLLSGGKGAAFQKDDDALAGEPFLAIAHLDGDAREAKIRLAAPLARAEIEDIFAERIHWRERCVWDTRENAVRARRERVLGALILEDLPWKDASREAVAQAATAGLRTLGLQALPWEGAGGRLRARVAWLRAQEGAESNLPDWSDAALGETLNDWLTPHLGRVRSKADFGALDLAGILRGTLDWEQTQRLDTLAPTHLETPAGTRAAIDYSSDPPAWEVKIQEMFGEGRHPAIMRGRVPLLIRFLSPARRPVQTTADLAGFWANSYAEIRKDLRGRYLKHPWPEDPLQATPTSRAKPRKS